MANVANKLDSQLKAISSGLKEGSLITTDLQVVKKHGFTWTLLSILRTIASPLYTLFGCCDPWGSFRINKVAQSILKFCQVNKKHFNEEQKKIALKIFATLAEKTKNDSYLSEVKKCKKLFRYAVSNPNGPETPAEIEFVPAPKADVERVRGAIVRFGDELHQKLFKENEHKSFAISSVSIMAVIAMSVHLLKPESKQKMLAKLELADMEEDKMHRAFATLLREIPLPKNATGSINIAQGLALKNDFAVADSFEALVQDMYDGEVFRDDQSKLVSSVNTWVSKKTKNMIPKLLDEKYPNIVLVLLNALFLELKWENKFKRPSGGWEKKDFTCSDGKKHPVTMMTQTGKNFSVFRAAVEGDGKALCDVLEMKYVSPSGRNLSRLFFLPCKTEDFTIFGRGLDPTAIKDVRERMAKRKGELEVTVSLPKIKAECKLSLLKMIRELGIPLNNEDLDQKMFGSKDDIFISDFVHGTVVEDDEEGTKAAAASAMVLEARCMPPSAPPHFDFIADRSYMYCIMDGDNILFSGTVNDAATLVVDKK